MLTEMQHNTLLDTYGLNIDGNIGYFIDNDRVIINIDGIRSDRAEGNVSGTLSLELWALNTPYAGQDFDGQALAGTQIGEMLGQHYLAGCEYDLIFSAPGAGHWTLCLMLREWNGEQYETRDYRNFDVPFIVEADLRLVETEQNDEATDTNVVDINSKRDAEALNKEAKTAAKSEPVKAKPKAETAVKKDEKKSSPVAKTSPVKKPAAKKEPVKKSATVKKNETKKVETKKAAEKTQPVSVNKASAAELAAVKGLSTKQAEAIVAARPYKSINDVVKAKGMGAKLLEKVRGSLKI